VQVEDFYDALLSSDSLLQHHDKQPSSV